MSISSLHSLNSINKESLPHDEEIGISKFPHKGESSAFDPAMFRRPQAFSVAKDAAKSLTKIAVRKPSNDAFIRTHPDPDCWYPTQVIEFKEEGEFYLVANDIAAALDDEKAIRSKLLVPSITRQGVVFIWPLALPDKQCRSNSWHESARQAAELAKDQWVRITSNRDASAYEATVATGNLTEPEFPQDLSFEKMMTIAFTGKIITTLDHPVLRRLRGEI